MNFYKRNILDYIFALEETPLREVNAMEEYVKCYNTQRITTKLKGLTPVRFRNQSLATV
ncbi:MAG: IS3 family transposase [Erysipelotrichaceae bacterium]|nr:IS3 family transposase [Erysipelotrichaceae bacterium]